MSMRASVIVPAKNAQDTLSVCLQALREQQNLTLGIDYEIIVVDDGSTDSTAQVAREYGVKVISQPNAGPASARNTGARHALGDIIAFTDADCVPVQDWLWQIIQPFKNPRVVGSKGVYLTREKVLTARFVQMEYESKYERMKHQEQIDFIDTYSAAYRRRIFLENNGFDEIFPMPSVEDQEFSFRLARKGYLLVFCPLAAVYHHHDLTIAEYIHRKYGIGYWKAVMLNWLPEKTFSDSHTPVSQRLQIVLMGAILASLALSVFWSGWVWFSIVCLVIFFLTTLPFLLFAIKRDPVVSLVTFPMLLLRALIMGTGLLLGFFHIGKNRMNRKGLNITERVIKRCVDLVGASVGLILSSPLILLSAIAVRLDSSGPIIFTQMRSGENGKPFRIYKLRSMTNGAEHHVQEVLKGNPLSGPVFKIPDDPRITRVGRFLRRWSLDELPQFWNVIKGDMSLVGPRPEETWVVDCYNDHQRQRLLVKPGMTGPMQVSGRGRLDLDARLELEMDYVMNYSLWKDFQMMAMTLRAIWAGDGAL